MKKLLLACSLVGIIAGANAHPMMSGAGAEQCPHNSEQCSQNSEQCSHKAMHRAQYEPAARAEYLQKTLQLSDEQAAKVKKLFEDKEQQRKALDDKYKPQFDAFRADMKKLREQTHTQLNGILTPKQQEALKTHHEAHGMNKEHGEMCPRDGKPLTEKPAEKPAK